MGKELMVIPQTKIELSSPYNGGLAHRLVELHTRLMAGLAMLTVFPGVAPKDKARFVQSVKSVIGMPPPAA